MGKPKVELLLSIGSTHRVVSDGIQWILQRSKGEGWVNEAYCLTRLGLELRLKPYALTLPDDWPESHRLCLKRRNPPIQAHFKSAQHM